MAKTSALFVLLFISGTLLSDLVYGRAAEVVTEAAWTTTPPPNTKATSTFTFESGNEVAAVNKGCSNFAAAGQEACPSITGLDDLNFALDGEDFNFCSFSLQAYACARVANLSAERTYNILNCFLSDNAIVTQNAVATFISKISWENLEALLSSITLRNPDVPLQTKSLILNAVIERLSQNPQIALPGVIASWIQNLYFFLNGLNEGTFQCLLDSPITCDGLESIVNVLNLQYSSFSNGTQRQIALFISGFIKTHSCSKSSVNVTIQSYYQQFTNNMNYADYEWTFEGMDLSSALSVFHGFQLVQYVSATNAFSSFNTSSLVLAQLESQDFNKVYEFLVNLPEGSYDNDILLSLSFTILKKLEFVDDPLCKPQLKAIFQGSFVFIFQSVNEDLMKKIVPSDCSEFVNIFSGFDKISSKLSESQKQLVAQYRLKFLEAETERSGSGCTYVSNSQEWVESVLGESLPYISYNNIIEINKNFDGYNYLNKMTITQITDMIEYTKLFTDASPVDADSRTALLTNYLSNKGIVQIKNLLVDLKRINIKIVINIKVRLTLMDNIWNIVSKQFNQLSASELVAWFNEYLTPISPSITAKQLSDLPVSTVGDCSNMQSIVKGLGTGFSFMSDDSKQGVTEWVTSGLRNQTDHCKSPDSDWLSNSYDVFSKGVSIPVIQELNPDYLSGHLDSFSPNQLGEYAAYVQEAHTNVNITQAMYTIIRSGTQEENQQNLAKFWDSYTSSNVEITDTTVEVKHYMLQETCKELSSSFSSFTEETADKWFSERLVSVLPVIDEEILSYIPVSAGCGFQKSFVKAFSSVYADTSDSSQSAVSSHIEKVLTYDDNNRVQGEKCTEQETSSADYLQHWWGSYKIRITFKILVKFYWKFNVFEKGVLQMLNSEQTGQLFVEEKVYESMENATQLMLYIKTQDAEYADQVFTSFTKTFKEENVDYLNDEVANYLLEGYLNIIQKDIENYTATQIGSLFESKIYPMIPSLSDKTLSMIPVKNCESQVSAVEALDNSYSRMSDQTRSAVANWVMSNLKNKLNGCKDISTSDTISIKVLLKRFIFYIPVTVLIADLNLNPLDVISETRVSQRAEFLSSSSCLSNASTTVEVLKTLVVEDSNTTIQNVFECLSDFNNFYEKSPQKMTNDVQQAAFDFYFNTVIDNLQYVSAETISQFEYYFKDLVSVMTAEQIQKIPLNVDCNSFYYFFATINTAYEKQSDSVRSAASQKILDYLDYNYKGGSSGVCSELYTDSRSYVLKIFFSFRITITIYKFQFYYKQFNVFDCLDLLSGKQLGNVLVNTTAYTDELQTAQVMVELKKHSYEEIKDCFREVNVVAKEKNINVLPNPNTQTIIHKAIWDTVSENLNSPSECEFWVKDGYRVLLPAVSATEIDSIKAQEDCTSQNAIVSGFSSVYDALSDDQKSSVFNRIKKVNKNILDSTGSACPTESGTSSAWINQTFGAFEKEASVKDMKDLNKNFSADEVLPQLSGQQLSEHVQDTKALSSVNTTTVILEAITTPDKMGDFLDGLNTNSGDALQSSPAGGLILKKCVDLYSPEFPSNKADDWKDFTQVKVKNIIHHIDEEELNKIPIPIDCSSFQEIVVGFNNAFDKMSVDTQTLVYQKIIKRQLDLTSPVSGVVCGLPEEKIEIWLDKNCAKFSVYANITDYLRWNKNYQAITVVNSLSPTQTADVAVSVVNNEEAACQVAGRVQQFKSEEVNVFLESFSGSFAQINTQKVSKVAVLKFISSALYVIAPSLNKYSSDQWQELINWFGPLLPSIDGEQLSILVKYSDCKTYGQIVNGLSDNYASYTPDTRQSLFGVLFAHVSDNAGEGGFCPVLDENSGAALTRMFGKFSGLLEYTLIETIIPNFKWQDSIDVLNPQQLAYITYSTNAFSDLEAATILNQRLAGLDADSLLLYIQSARAAADLKNIQIIPNGAIQTLLFTTITNTLSAKYNSFSDSQWNSFIYSCGPFLSSIQVSQVNQIPDTISCNALQSIVAGLNIFYERQSGDAQLAIANKIKAILELKSSSGSGCSAANSIKWLELFWGFYSERVDLSILSSLNPNFSPLESISYLTPEQQASYMADPSVLIDVNKVDKALSGVASSNLRGFLGAFNQAMKAKGISGVSSISVRRFFMGSIFCKGASLFLSFLPQDYANFFSQDLQFFLSSIDAKCFGFLPAEIGCDSLANIMEPILAVSNLEYPNDVFNFVASRLDAIQASTDDACAAGLDTKTWTTRYFGQVAVKAEYSQLMYWFPGFNVAEVSYLLSSTQLAMAFSSSTVISVENLSTVIEAASMDIEFFGSFLDTIRTTLLLNPGSTLSPDVVDTLLSVSATKVFPKFDALASSNVQTWMDRISIFSSSLNSTYLENIPSSISCDNLEVVVKFLNLQAPGFAESRKRDIANFLLSTLNAKANASGGAGACNSDISLITWVSKFIRSFCLFLSADQLTTAYPGIAAVSYETIVAAYQQP